MPKEAQYADVTFVRIPRELREQVWKIAKDEDRTLTAQLVVLLRRAVADHLAKSEPAKKDGAKK